MKKLTKKEIELIENEKREKARVRRTMISDLKNYWQDVEAVIRVAKINGETEKLKYNDRLNEEETQKLLNRYESIKDLSDNQKQIIRTLINNERDRRDNTAKEYLSEDSIWIRDIIWKEEDLKEITHFLKELGIEKIYYTNKSTNVMEVLVWLTKIGAKIIGTTNISEYNEGLIIEV